MIRIQSLRLLRAPPHLVPIIPYTQEIISYTADNEKQVLIYINSITIIPAYHE